MSESQENIRNNFEKTEEANLTEMQEELDNILFNDSSARFAF